MAIIYSLFITLFLLKAVGTAYKLHCNQLEAVLYGYLRVFNWATKQCEPAVAQCPRCQSH